MEWFICPVEDIVMRGDDESVESVRLLIPRHRQYSEAGTTS